jgi:hypothetical protein
MIEESPNLTATQPVEERAAGSEEARLVAGLSNQCLYLLGLRRDEDVVALARSTIESSCGERTQGLGYVLAHLTASLTFLYF